MKPKSLTLIRSSPSRYQVTVWDDGTVRWDGTTGLRYGSWQGRADPAWFGRAAARRPQVPSPLESVDEDKAVTLVIDFGEHLDIHRYIEGTEPEAVWIMAMVIDGIAAEIPWCPLDPAGEVDFSPWGSGVPMVLVQGDFVAQALATADGLVVLAGSNAATSTAATLEENYKKKRRQLEEDGGFQLTDDRFFVTRHLLFGSPSGAASVLAGSNTNGRRAWKDTTGRSWADLGLEIRPA